MSLALLCTLLAAAPAPTLTGQKVTLPNGLVVIVSPDHTAPGVAVDVWYRVGSRDEEPGRTGFAHLFEHLMFMGARYAPYPKFDSIMEASGGANNASTAQDVTNYHEAGPSPLLETFLWLEADRMATLDREMNDEKVKSQRLIVQNERRQSYENRPYGMADLAVEEQVYPKGHPYSWSPIGSHEDLEAASTADVLKFFRTWYVPNNAVLSVVGDVEPARVFELATKYFAFLPAKALPRKAPPAPYTMPAEKKVALTDKVETEKLVLAWPSAKAGTDADAESDLLAAALGQGDASRLFQRLVKKDQLATSVTAQQQSLDYGGIFAIEVMAAPGKTTAQLQAAVDDEVRKLLERGPTQAELDASRARIETSFARSLQGLESRAQLLAGYEVHYGDPNAMEKDLARYAKATPASVQATAKALFVPGRLVVEVTPVKGGAK